MDMEMIRALAGLLAEQGLSALEVSEGDWRVKLERAATPAAAMPAVAPAMAASDVTAEDGAVPNFSALTPVISPVVGVFYAAASPEAEPFVAVGDKVKRGDVLCIVEAMKLMNEITAEADGEIVDICVRNGEIVEFGQTLFKMY